MTLTNHYVFFAAMSFVFGTCIGSFLNVCIYRIPREESVVRPRSHCPHCNGLIAWYDNIPLFSFVALRARCRHCAARISPRYVLVEALVGLFFLLIWLKLDLLPAGPVMGLSPVGSALLIPIYWLVVSGLVLGTFVDFEYMIIPDRVTLGGIAAGLVLSAAVPALHGQATVGSSLLQAGMGLALGWSVLWLMGVVGTFVFRKEAMGFGDVKLLGAIGAFLGWRAVVFTIIVSSFLGSAVGIALVLLHKKEMQSRMPYGPYISLAAVLWILWGAGLWSAYIGLMTPAALPGP